MVLILFAFAPVNDLVNLLLCGLAVVFFRKPERDRAGQAIIVGAAFLALVLAPVIFRAANMWLPAEKIVLRGQLAVVGYVLAADPRYATVLRAADATDPPVGRRRVTHHRSAQSRTGVSLPRQVSRWLGLETHTPVLARTPWRSWPCPVRGLVAMVASMPQRTPRVSARGAPVAAGLMLAVRGWLEL